MKKTALLLALLVLIPVVAADAIMPDTHAVNRCVKILDDAPSGYALVGHIGPPMPDDSYVIQKDTCLTKGYKFSQFQVLLVKTDYLDAVGVNNLDLQNESVIVSSENIDPYGGYVYDSNPKVKETIEYKIRQQEGEFGQDFLEKISEIDGYEDGSSKEVYPNGENVTAPELIPDARDVPLKRTFWENLGCFFHRLFGGTC